MTRSGAAVVETLVVYFTMVRRSDGSEVRTGPAYGTRETARSWLGFVSAAHGGLPVFVERCPLRLVDGRLDERSVSVLDSRYNMDPPAEPGSALGGDKDCDDTP